MLNKDIEWKELKDENGNVYKEKWPFYKGQKAISPSSLTKPLSWLVYGYSEKIVKHIGMTMNENLEKTVSHYLSTYDWKSSINFIKRMPPKAFSKAQRTLKKLSMIFKKPIEHKIHTIYYEMFNGYFIACETDIDFKNAIWEIKMSDIPREENKNLYFKALFMVQCKIQQICSGKKVSLLHIDSLKVYKDPKEYNINNLLLLLLDIYKNRKELSPTEQMTMIENFFKQGQLSLW